MMGAQKEGAICVTKFYAVNIETREVLNKRFHKAREVYHWNYGVQYFASSEKIPPVNTKDNKNVTAVNGRAVKRMVEAGKLELVEKW